MRLIPKLLLLMALVAGMVGLVGGWMLSPGPVVQESQPAKMAPMERKLNHHVAYTGKSFDLIDRHLDVTDSHVRAVEDVIPRMCAHPGPTVAPPAVWMRYAKRFRTGRSWFT